MQIGLGLVAGLMLAEIIVGEQALVRDGEANLALGGMSEPLLALVGGFSAGVIHMVLNSIVNALRRAFGAERDDGEQRAARMATYAQGRTDAGVAEPAARRRSDVQPLP